MRGNRLSIGVTVTLAVFTMSLFMTSTLAVAQEQVLHSFNNNGTDGVAPYGGVIFDAAGNLYGTTDGGGTHSVGTVFELTPAAGGGWTEQVLHSFGSGTDAAYPTAALIFDTDGNLYSTTTGGGAYGKGTVFELTPAAGGSWTEKVLYSFGNGTDGYAPYSGLVFDAAGNLYGTTYYGGTYSRGTVFELTPQAGGGWTEQVLHSFGNGTDAGGPFAALTFDAAGNLYSTAQFGGTTGGCAPYGCGAVFELSPAGGGSWTEKLVYSFSGNGTDGTDPKSGVIFDAAGNLYGTTYVGGASSLGTLFELTPAGGGSWTEKVLHSFGNGTDGANPYATPIFDTAGSLYGTTYAGGSHSDGTIYNLTPGSGGSWTEQVLHNFNNDGTDGVSPFAGLIFDAASNLYGTTTAGGTHHNSGTVFQLPVTVNQTLTVAIFGDGTVTSTDGFIHCPGTCSYSYPYGTPVTLNATPDHGWIFGGWNGGCLGTSSCTVTMTKPISVDAIFSEALQFVAVTPCRVVDTRKANGTFGGPPIQGGSYRSFPVPQSDCDIPATALSYSLNVTVVPHGSLSYLTIWPAGEIQPVISTMNSLDGRIKANAAIVPAGTSGAVSVYASNTTDVVLDIDGYFTPVSGSTLAFYPLTPCRVLDTRNASGLLGGPFLASGNERDFPVLSSDCNIPSTAVAYSMNFTVVPYQNQPLGYLTVWPQGGTRPVVSTLNNLTATIVANGAIVPAGTGGGIATYPAGNTQLVADIDGYFAPAGTGGLSLYPGAPCRVIDTRKGSGQFSGELTVNVVASPCETPSNAQAYVFNATAVPVGELGYLTLWPDTENQPVVSTLNAIDGAITSNMAIVPTVNGKIDAYASGTTQLVLDISSYFAP